MKSASQIRWKEIMSQWNQQFPFLKPYGTMRLFYRTDIFLIGLLLDKIHGQDYRLTFEIKAIWEYLDSNDFNLINRYILRDPTERLSNFWLDYSEHDLYFQEAVMATHRQYDDILYGKASYDFLMKENEVSYYYRNPLNYYYEIWYIAFRLATTLFFKDMEKWDQTYVYLEDRYGLWEKKLLKNKRVYGVTSIDEIVRWRKNVEYFLSDRDRLLSICEENSKIKKIRHLNKGELIYTPYVEKIDEEKQQESLFAKIMSSIKNRFT